MIKLSKSSIGNEEKDAVTKVLQDEYLGMGLKVQEFENKLEDFFSREAVCIVNGTAALHLALEACQFPKQSEVLVPSLTYVASFQAITAAGLKPIACDIETENFLLDIKDAEKRITNKSVAIMPVHYSGGVGDLDELYNFAKVNKLRLIEDAAHAFGSEYGNKRIGSFGDIVCFSFDGIKNITSGEGGCIVTSDNKILDYVKDARLLGVVKDTEKRFNKSRSWEFDVNFQGWRYHMSNLMAAIGIEQLNKSDSFFKRRKEIALAYDSLFADNKKIIPLIRDYKNVVPHIYVVQIKDMEDRDTIKAELLEKGIEVGFHYQPNHLLSFYKNENISLPVTEKVYKELLTLPLHVDLSQDDISHIASSLKQLL